MITTVLFLLTALFTQFSVNAQAPTRISLQQALQTALDSNLSVKSAAYTIEVQKALKKSAWDLGKTNFNVEYGQLNSYHKDNNFSINHSFAFPALYIQQAKLAGANQKGSEWQFQNKQLEMSNLVKTVYWQLTYLFAKQKLLVYQDSIFSRFFRAAQRKAELGETNRLEMMTARSQSLEIKNQLQQTLADISIQNRKFRYLLNSTQILIPADTVLHRLEFTIPTDSKATADNPELNFANNLVKAARIEKKVEQNKQMPEFNFGYFNQSIIGNQDINGSSRVYGTGDRFTGFQAGISIPVWFIPGSAKIKAAKINEKIAETNAINFKKTLENTYQSLLDEYKKFSSSVEYYEKQALPEAEIIIVQSEKSYKAGALDYLEYIQSLNRALSIRQAYLETIQNYNQTIVNLDFITGKIY